MPKMSMVELHVLAVNLPEIQEIDTIASKKQSFAGCTACK